MITSFLDLKDFNDWRNDPTKKEGATKLNLEYLRELKQLEHELAGIGVIIFFLVTNCDMRQMQRLLLSAGKQRRLLSAIQKDLKTYALDSKWEKMFKAQCTRIRNRINYIYLIIEENIKLTEYYPWFMAVGKDRLQDFEHKYRDGDDEASSQLFSEIQEWNSEHEKEIKEHVESIAEEKARYEKRRQERWDEKRAEKQAVKISKKMEKDEEKEIKENKNKHAKEERKLNKEWGLNVTQRERSERIFKREKNKKALTERARKEA